ncbi:MAG: hypothetical protein ACYC2K_11135 [Gemmatimonadales bacterium]
MSNTTAQPLNDRRARVSPPLADGSRNVLIQIHVSGKDVTQSDAQALASELTLLATRRHSGQLLDILRGVNRALRLEEDPEHSSLTESEIEALRAAGSLVEPEQALPIEERPSVRTALRQEHLLAEALTTEDVAKLLDVSTGRVRQRNAEGSLLSMSGATRGLRFPRFQFTERGELPGWATVCKALPEHANPVAVEHFLSHTHPDLADGEVTPAQWLAAGKPAKPVAALAEQAFTIR